MLGPAIFDRVVGMGAKGFESVDGVEAEGTGAVIGGAGGNDEAGAEGDGDGGSSVCSTIGDRSPCGLLAAGSSLAGPGGGR